MVTIDGFQLQPLDLSGTAIGALVAGQVDDDDDHMDWDWDGGAWVMVGFMGLFWLGVLIVAAWGVATYARNSSRREDSALESARRRYARGEINAEEFDRIKRDLG